MADDLRISEMVELLEAGLHDDIQFEVIDLTEVALENQNKRVKLVTLEAAFGAEDRIFKGTTIAQVYGTPPQVTMSMDLDDLGQFRTFFNAEGDNDRLDMGLADDIFLRVGLGSGNEIRIMSGTDTWFYVDADKQRLGNTVAGNNYWEVEQFPQEITGFINGEQRFFMDPNAIRIGNIAAGGNYLEVDELNNAIKAFVEVGDTTTTTQVLDIDGVANTIFIGDQALNHVRMGIGSDPEFRVMSGTDTWLYIHPDFQRLGSNTAGDSYLAVSQVLNQIQGFIAGDQRFFMDSDRAILGDIAAFRMDVDWGDDFDLKVYASSGDQIFHVTENVQEFGNITDSYIKITNSVNIECFVNSIKEVTIGTGGLALKTGATVNEIEIALTNDATHIPTSSAVFAALHPADLIAEGNSSVEVIDAGTGQVDITVDGGLAARFQDAGPVMAIRPDEQIEAVIGRMLLSDLGAVPPGADHFALAHFDNTGPAEYALAQFAAGDTWLNALTGNEVVISVGSVAKVIATATTVELKNTVIFSGGAANTGVGPQDWTLNCGTQKTLVLGEPVYEDANLGGAVLHPIPAQAPDVVQFVDEAGANTGIYTYGYAVGEAAGGNIEIPHAYKEGTDLSFHVHFNIIAAPTGTDNVQWQLTYTISRNGETLDAPRVINTADIPVDTQYEAYLAVFPNISGTTGGVNGGGIQIGDQFLFTLERVAATGDAFAGDALVETAGIHHQVDTMGSRQIATK